MNKQELIEYCLSFPKAYKDSPPDKPWIIIKHGENNRVFAYIYERRKGICVDLRCEPDLADFFRQKYKDITSGYQIKSAQWNSVYIGGDVPEEELCYMIRHSYNQAKPKLWPQKRTIAEKNKVWPNNFYFKLYGQNYNMPDNAEEAIEYVLNMLSKREKEAVLSRYKDYKTLVAIGLEQGLSGNRIDQILSRAFRRMRHPVRSRFLINLHEEIEKDKVAEAERLQKACIEQWPIANDIAMVTIEYLDLSVRAYNCLRRGNVKTLADLSKLSTAELMRFRNIGRRTCEEIKAACEKYGVIIE